MNFLILGGGDDELAWARRLADDVRHGVRGAYPGFDDLPELARPGDLEEALALADVEAAIVGGEPEFRAEALRRVAALGWPAICLHPPGPDAEPYYMVALSREETGAVIVPDLPFRLHPGVERLRQTLETQELGPFRELRYEAPTGDAPVLEVLARMVDVVRALLGEVEALTAAGDPPGPQPSGGVVVHLRDASGRRAELRPWAGPPGPARLALLAAQGSLILEVEPDLDAPSRVVLRTASAGEQTQPLGPWDARGAILGILEAAVAQRPAHPDLLDGTRAMEVVEAVSRSLRRGRTVELHYEEISEEASFKSVMTSTGCTLLILVLFVLPLALAGPAFGLGWTLYFAYAIPPLLVLFFIAQTLRFAIRKRPAAAGAHPAPDDRAGAA